MLKPAVVESEHLSIDRAETAKVLFEAVRSVRRDLCGK